MRKVRQPDGGRVRHHHLHGRSERGVRRVLDEQGRLLPHEPRRPVHPALAISPPSEAISEGLAGCYAAFYAFSERESNGQDAVRRPFP